MSLLAYICKVWVFVEFQFLADGPVLSFVGGISCLQASQTCCKSRRCNKWQYWATDSKGWPNCYSKWWIWCRGHFWTFGPNFPLPMKITQQCSCRNTYLSRTYRNLFPIVPCHFQLTFLNRMKKIKFVAGVTIGWQKMSHWWWTKRLLKKPAKNFPN